MKPYALLEVGVIRHPKVAGLSSDAFRVWVAGLLYAQEYLTDGRIPASALRTGGLGVPTRPEDVDELITAGLWERRGSDVVVHDYLVLNKSRKEVEAARIAARARAARYRNGDRR